MKRLFYVFTAICLVGGAFVSPLASRPDADRADQQHQKTLTVDVALDSATLVVNMLIQPSRRLHNSVGTHW